MLDTNITWMKPSRRGSGGSKRVPAVNVSIKPFWSGDKKKSCPYYRFSVNNYFLQEFYPDLDIKTDVIYIAVSVEDRGVLIDVKPGKGQDQYKFNKGRSISDNALAMGIFSFFKVPIKDDAVNNLKLHVKKWGQYKGRLIFELTMIADENEVKAFSDGPRKMVIEG